MPAAYLEGAKSVLGARFPDYLTMAYQSCGWRQLSSILRRSARYDHRGCTHFFLVCCIPGGKLADVCCQRSSLCRSNQPPLAPLDPLGKHSNARPCSPGAPLVTLPLAFFCGAACLGTSILHLYTKKERKWITIWLVPLSMWLKGGLVMFTVRCTMVASGNR